MARPTKDPIDPDDAPLKRLGGGRWQTRDERFTIEPQSGTWVVVDGEQTDDLGLPLVRGPFPSLTSAKAAISGARAGGPVASPLAEQIERRRREPAEPAKRASARHQTARTRVQDGAPGAAANDSRPAEGGATAAPRRRASVGTSGATSEQAPREPGWLADLEPAARGRARRLIDRLGEDGAADAEGLVRRDLVGGVPALAAHAIARHLERLGSDAPPAAVAEILADGRDDGLGVRWRLVDGEGRPIVLDPAGRRR